MTSKEHSSSILDGFQWTETKAVLEEFKSLLACSLCGDVATSPHNLGRCHHVFCFSCLEKHNGGACPAAQCGVHAPASEKRPNKTQEQIIKSVLALGELLLGESVPEKPKEQSPLKEGTNKRKSPSYKITSEGNADSCTTIKKENPTSSKVTNEKESASTNTTIDGKSVSSKEIKEMKPASSEINDKPFNTEVLNEELAVLKQPSKQLRNNGLKRTSLPLPGTKVDQPLKQKRQKVTSAGAIKFPKQKEKIDNALVNKPTKLTHEVVTKISGTEKNNSSILSANISFGSDSDFEPTSLSVKSNPKVFSNTSDKGKPNHRISPKVSSSNGLKPSPVTQKKASPKVKPKPKSLDKLNKKNQKGETPLHTAASKGDLETVRRLLKEGASPNTWDNAGWMPLHEASSAGNLPLVTLLLDAGASPSVPATNENLTPLHDAASAGHVDVVAVLVARGADTAAKDSRGMTPKDVSANDKIAEALQTEVEVSCSQLDRSQVMEERKEVVVAALGVGEVLWKHLDVAARKVGVTRMCKTVTEEVTHCLMEPQESVDYYMALLCGAELVSNEWLLQCGAAGHLVDEEPFRVCIPGGNLEGLCRAKDGRSKRLPGLMAGGHVYLVGSFDSAFPTRQHIVKLVKMAGGKVVFREPDPELIPPDEQTVFYHAAASSSLVKTSHIIIYQAGSRKEPMIKYKMPHLKTLPVSWLFECFNTYSLVEPNLFE